MVEILTNYKTPTLFFDGKRQQRGILDTNGKKPAIFWLDVASSMAVKNLFGLEHESLVIGLIGPRGSGKSLHAARIAILDHLLKGKRVWSNMEVSIKRYQNGVMKTITTDPLSKLRLKDMDLLYSNGALLIDEVNMEVAEARRSQSKTNLVMNNIVQQLRKRRLDFVWTAQSEMHVDSRLRWQTDIFIKCTNVSRRKGPGELSKLDYYDYSGIIKGKSPDTQKEAHLVTLHQINKPWWHVFYSWQLQGQDDEETETTDFEFGVDNINSSRPGVINYSRFSPLLEMIQKGQIVSMYSEDLFKDAGVEHDRAGQMALVKEIKRNGFTRKRESGTGKYFYIKT